MAVPTPDPRVIEGLLFKRQRSDDKYLEAIREFSLCLSKYRKTTVSLHALAATLPVSNTNLLDPHALVAASKLADDNIANSMRVLNNCFNEERTDKADLMNALLFDNKCFIDINKQLHLQCQAATAQHESSRQAHEAYQRQCGELNNRLVASNAELEYYRSQANEAEQQRKERAAQAVAQRQSTNDHQKVLRQLQSRFDAVSQSLSEGEQRHTDQQASIHSLELSLGQSEQETKTAHDLCAQQQDVVEGLKNMVSELEISLGSTRGDLEDTKQLCDTQRASITSLEMRVQHQEADAETSARELMDDNLSSQLEGARRTLRETIANFDGKLKDSHDSRQAARESLETKSLECTAKEGVIELLRTEINDLLAGRERLAAEHDLTTEELSRARTSLTDLSRQLNHTTHEHETDRVARHGEFTKALAESDTQTRAFKDRADALKDDYDNLNFQSRRRISDLQTEITLKAQSLAMAEMETNTDVLNTECTELKEAFAELDEKSKRDLEAAESNLSLELSLTARLKQRLRAKNMEAQSLQGELFALQKQDHAREHVIASSRAAFKRMKYAIESEMELADRANNAARTRPNPTEDDDVDDDDVDDDDDDGDGDGDHESKSAILRPELENSVYRSGLPINSGLTRNPWRGPDAISTTRPQKRIAEDDLDLGRPRLPKRRARPSEASQLVAGRAEKTSSSHGHMHDDDDYDDDYPSERTSSPPDRKSVVEKDRMRRDQSDLTSPSSDQNIANDQGPDNDVSSEQVPSLSSQELAHDEEFHRQDTSQQDGSLAEERSSHGEALDRQSLSRPSSPTRCRDDLYSASSRAQSEDRTSFSPLRDDDAEDDSDPQNTRAQSERASDPSGQALSAGDNSEDDIDHQYNLAQSEHASNEDQSTADIPLLQSRSQRLRNPSWRARQATTGW